MKPRQCWLSVAAAGALIALTPLACSRSAQVRTGPTPRAVSWAPTPSPTAVAPAVAVLPTQGEDVLVKAREANSDSYSGPPSEFRQGHVTPIAQNQASVQRESRRFVAKLPSGAPVTTPAVHHGLVLVSGGFHSREFYAFKAKTGEPAWGVNLDDDGPSAPACERGTCVFNTESCTLFGIEAETGKMLWSWWLGDPLMSAPTIANGRVFASYPASGRFGMAQNAAAHQAAAPPKQQAKPSSLASPSKLPAPGVSHVLAAFDLQTGRILWQRWIDADVMSAPIAYGTILYATSFAGTVYAFDQATGEILAARADRATSAPVLAQGALFYTRRSDDQRVVQEDVVAVKGHTRQNVYTKEAPYLDPNVQKKAALKGQSQSLDASNGFGSGAPGSANASVAEGLLGQGHVSSLQSFQGSRILSMGNQQINAMGDEVVCTNATSGTKVWSHPLRGNMHKEGGFLAAPPLAAGGRLLVGTLEGDIQVLAPETGAQLTAFHVGSPIRSQPVVEDGWIYVGTVDGKLVGIDTGNPQMSGWPMWGRDAARTGVL